MTRVRVESFTISLDGYGAGPGQGIDNPLGVGGTDLHQWAFPTRTFQRNLLGADGGTTGIDDDFAARGFENIGAWILGRNMFGPIRGPWPDMTWKGWWVTTHPTMFPSSSCLITHAQLFRWKAKRPFTSSQAVFTTLWSWHARQPMEWTFVSEVAHTLFSSTFVRASLTRCT
jgi:dihydrofolate reductase